MKTILLSGLFALTAVGAHAANLYSSNLGNGLSTLGSVSGIASGTVRFGVFPPGFDFAGNAEDYSDLDAAFTEVYSFSGPLTVAAAAGFYQTAHTYDVNGTYEGQPYSSIAGQKVYIWILNAVDPSLATQQAIFSTNQTWVAADAVIQDTVVSPDSGASGLQVHLGALANGNNIGAGAPSHTTSGALVEVNGVAVVRSPAAGAVLEDDSVTFTATVAEGTFPLSYQWRRNGLNIPGATASTYVIPAAILGDAGNYDVIVSNVVSGGVESNSVPLMVVTTTPAILTGPLPTIVAVGSTLNLSVDAVAAGLLTYQWKKGADIPGATGPVLTLPNMTLANAGTYTVNLANAAGKLSSDKAEVIVVNQAPETVVSGVNGTVVLKAVVAGKGASFQWFRGITRIFNSPAKFAGATTDTLIIRRVTVHDSHDYTCVVSFGGAALPAGVRTVKVFTERPEIDLTKLPMPPNGRVGATYAFRIPVNPAASKAPATYSVSGMLPPGLKLDAKTGIISGRPTKAGTYGNIVLRAANAAGGVSEPSPPQTIVILEFPAGLVGSYAGVVDRQPAVLGGALGGRFEMAVSNTGAVSGKLFLGVDTLPLVGVIESDQTPVSAQFRVERKNGLTPLDLSFEFKGDGYLDKGFITDGVGQIPFGGWQNVWSATAMPANAYAGSYNLLIGLEEGNQNVGNQGVPQGFGFASATVSKDGKITFSGKTSDKEGITTAAILGPDGEGFFFQPVGSSAVKGSILGSFKIASAGKNLTGAATMSRPGNPATANRLYKNGYGNDAGFQLIVLGGAYADPKPSLVLGLQGGAGNAVFAFEFGGIDLARQVKPAATLRVPLSVESGNKVNVFGENATAVKFTTVNAAKGNFAGNFTLLDDNPLTPAVNNAEIKRTVNFEGLIVPANGDLIGVGFGLVDQIPAVQGETTKNTPILSGAAIFEVSE